MPTSAIQPIPFLSRLLPVIALLVPLSLLGLIAWVNWNIVWRAAEQDLQGSATSVAEYGRQTFETYAGAGGRLNDRLRGMSDEDIRSQERTLHLDLQRMDGDMSRRTLAYVIDREGGPLLSSTLYPVPRDGYLGDRDYFVAMAQDRPPEVFVSQTFFARYDGRLLFAVARRREATGNGLAPGAFDGVVVVAVTPKTLSEGLRRLRTRPEDMLVIVRPDGISLGTTSASADSGKMLPNVHPSSPFHQFAAENARKATFVSHTVSSGITTLVSMEKIEGFPLYAVSLRHRSAIIARWQETMIPYLIFAIPASLALFVLSRRVVRDQQQLQRRNLNLASLATLSADRLGRAKRFGLVGTFEYDLRTGVSRRSPEYMSIQGLPAVATDETHEDWRKRLHPDDRIRALEELEWALSDESGAEEYGQSYRILTPDGSVRWIAARGVIRRDAEGRAIMLLGAHTDVTPLRSSEMALAESDARLRLAHEAVGIGTWEWLPQQRRLNCSNRMLEIFGLDPENPTPRPSLVLRRVHPDDRPVLMDHLRRVGTTERFHCEFRLVTESDSGPRTVWVSARAALVALTPREVPQVMGIVHDVTDQKSSEDMIRLMANEVEHRAKNTLALISAMLRMTRATSAAELAQQMQGRIRALSSTMGILRKSRWSGANLADILSEAIEPFTEDRPDGASPVTMSGPPVHIPVEAAQPVSLAVHELATNASKYGALSTPNGRLDLVWHVAGGRLHVLWTETGGPSVAPKPANTGFGSRLVAILFEAQLGGTVTREWRETGLVCSFSFPLTPAGRGHGTPAQPD